METFKTLLARSRKKIVLTVKIVGAVLIIPVIAWVAEFVYTHYINPEQNRSAPDRMMLAERDNDKSYDYMMPFSLIRKYRRMHFMWITKPHEFKDSLEIKEQIDRLYSAFEAEYNRFVPYFYAMQERYRNKRMPLKLQRRLMYYRSVIREKMGQVAALQAVFANIENK